MSKKVNEQETGQVKKNRQLSDGPGSVIIDKTIAPPKGEILPREDYSAAVEAKGTADDPVENTTKTPATATKTENGTTTPPEGQKPAGGESRGQEEGKPAEDQDDLSTMEGPAGDLIRKQLGISNEKKYEDQIIQGYNDQIRDMDSFISQMQSNVQKTEAEADEENKAKKKMFASDLTEAAAAIANLIGTTRGATSQQWTSPHQTWVQRVDTLRKEREEKLNTYRTQLASLNQAKRQLQQNKASTALSYERLRSQESANESKLQLQAEQLQEKIRQNDANLDAKLKGIKAANMRAILSNAQSNWSNWYKNQVKENGLPSEKSRNAAMKAFIQMEIDGMDEILGNDDINDPRSGASLQNNGFQPK